MSQTYAVAESAHAELAQLRARLLAAVNNRQLIADGPLFVLATTESAKRIYWRRVREVMGKAYFAVGNDHSIAIQCPACRKVEIVKGDVTRFRCRCSPAVERFAHQCRSIEV